MLFFRQADKKLPKLDEKYLGVKSVVFPQPARTQRVIFWHIQECIATNTYSYDSENRLITATTPSHNARQKKIWLNFFSKNYITTSSADWKKKPIYIMDGGDSFFNVLYDLKSGIFSELWINGES